MFTGLVQQVGEVTAGEDGPGGRRLVIGAAGLAERLAPGDSVAIDGVCLTVSELVADAGTFAVDIVPTTLRRTTLGEVAPGRRVNLEAAVRAGEPLGGHIVQGHVDGVGVVTYATREDEALVLGVLLPDEVAPFTVERGSLTLDGVSLTVAELAGRVAKLAIIPYTLGHTNLGRLEERARVNLEADVIAKYVARLLDPYRPDEDEGPPGD